LLGDNIRNIRKSKKISLNNLARMSGISVGYISDLENNKFTNPTLDKLKKIAQILEVQTTDFFNDDLSESNSFEVKEESNSYSTEFKTAEAAMQFILKQPSIMGYGGFDINKLSEKEIVQFANELLSQLQLLGLKYRK
jgi:transcriptional regulator with XRE-family HTH domain